MNKRITLFLKKKQKTASKALIMCVCIGFLGYNNSTTGMMEDEDASSSTSHQPRRFSPNLQTIFQHVEQGLSNIDREDIGSKDLIIVLGKTQIGKSTTIDALLGASLRRDGRKIIMDPSPGQRFAPIGSGSVSETKLPELYSVPGSPFAFLDTRGFYDVRYNPEEDIAASILTEIAVNKAKTVRVMFLEKYASLAEGVVGFRPLGTIIRKIIGGRMGQQVPILFVFNRYIPPLLDGEVPPGYVSPTEQDIIEKIIPQDIETLIEGESTILSDLLARTARKLGRPADAIGGLKDKFKAYFLGSIINTKPTDMEDIARDTEFQNAFEEVRYINILRYNKNRRNVGYINPLNEESKARLLQALYDLSPITRDNLAFNGYNSERIEFNRAFAREVGNLLPFINLKRQVSRYDVDLLRELAEEAGNCCAYHANVQQNFDGDHLTEERRKELEEAYAISMQDKQYQIQQLENRKSKLKLKNGKIYKSITNLLSVSEKLYWVDDWKEECGFFKGWWRNHYVYYPHDTPFVRWAPILQPGTYQKQINYANTPYLDINYTSNFAKDCEGKVEVYVAPKDDPETKESIDAKNLKIANNERQVSICDSQIANLQREVHGGLREKIAAKIRTFNEQKTQLEKAIRLRQKVDELYNAKKNKIELCTRIAKNIQSNGQIVIDFLDAWKMLNSREEQCDLPSRLRDPIFLTLLLDPVQLQCPNGGHGQALERSSIASYLESNRGRACPSCRAPISGITPVAPMVTEISDIINEIFTITLASQAEVERLSREGSTNTNQN